MNRKEACYATDHWSFTHLASRHGPRRSFPSAVMGMRHTSSVRTGLLMRAFMGWYPWGCRPCSLRPPSFSCGAARLTRRPQPPWPLSSRLPDFGPFFVALVIPGAGLVDPGQRLTRKAFVPAPLLTAAVRVFRQQWDGIWPVQAILLPSAH